MKQPWTERKQLRRALDNADVVVGERTLADGARLRGLYAARDFATSDCVASYHGIVCTRAELVALHDSNIALFEHISEYAVQTSAGDHLYTPVEALARAGGHLINHSCAPNAIMRGYAEGAALFRALRPVARGQELTIHYSWIGIKAAHDGRVHPCACGVPMCVGTIELGIEWVETDEHTGGPYLPPPEVAKRFLADIFNDSDANEALLHRYAKDAKDATTRSPGVEHLSHLDPIAFAQKLREGAQTALDAAQVLKEHGKAPSARRVAQIERTYHVRGRILPVGERLDGPSEGS